MKYVIGDIHGKKEIVEFFLNNFEQRDLIFVGDILDSYDRSVEDQIESLMMIKESGAQMLMGNHELSYISRRHQCSGYNGATSAHVIHIEHWIKALPKYMWVDDVLVSHAGLSLDWLGSDDPTVEEVKEFLNGMSKDDMLAIGYTRGGFQPIGGLLWEDFRDHVPIPRVTQVMGHTRGNGIRQKGTSFCIDCLEDDDKIKYVGIEDGKVFMYNELGDDAA